MKRLRICEGLLVALIALSHSTAQTDPFSQLRNVSTRGMVAPGDGTMISGFVIQESAPKDVLIRASGPGLSFFGVSNPLQNPTLSIFDARGRIIAQNAGWGGATNADQIRIRASDMGAFPFAAGSGDNAILMSLEPGTYTAHVTGSAQGIALLELYGDRQASPDARIVNMSSRIRVGVGESVGIVGLLRVNKRRLLIRAVGPSLEGFGVRDFLRDPMLELVQPEWAGGTRLSPVTWPAITVAKSDDWGDPTEILAAWPRLDVVGIPAEIREASRNSGAFPLAVGSKDSAMLIVLGQTDTLTMNLIVRDAGGGSGVALLEIYDLGEP